MAIKFDLSSIPEDVIIKDAILSLYAYDKNNGTVSLNNGPKKLYPYTSSWTESDIKWSGAPKTSSTLITYNKNSSLQVWEDFNVTDYVKGVVESDNDNYGFQLSHSQSSYGVKYRSSEYSDQEFRPKLTISYELPTSINQNISQIRPDQNYTVTITNVLGREINTFKTNNLKNLKRNLPSGVHIIQITTPQKRLIRKFSIFK